jgi:UDP-glucose 4-epimerase
MKLRGKPVLVTGGAGFMGSFLVGRLLSEGARVKVLDNLSTGRVENLNDFKGSRLLNLTVGDLKDRKTALEAVREVEVVFHFAANPEVRVSTTNPATHFDENVLSTFNLLEAMRIAGDPRYLVFASSSSVYGEPKRNPVSEDTQLAPVSVYGASKAACEMLIRAYSELYGIRSVVLRYANVVGPRLRHGVIYDFIVKLKKDPHRLEILGDGGQRRSFLWVEDAVDATLKALNALKRGFEVYNVGNTDWIGVNDVADEVVSVMGLKGVNRVYKPILHGVGWAGDVKQVRLDVGKIRKLGWKPAMNSRESARSAAEALLREITRNLCKLEEG